MAMRSRILVPVLLLAALAGAALPAHAVTVDGRAEAAYGAARSVQSNPTDFNDASTPYGGPDIRMALGSELDAAYGVIEDGVLHLVLAGNVGFCCGYEFSHQESLHLFLDCGQGGQHTLRADNRAGAVPDPLMPLGGLTFDAGFTADHWLAVTVNVNTSFAVLPAAAGASGGFVGYDNGSGGGMLVGGANPYGILAAMDNTNLAGVPHGCGTADGTGVTSGVEVAIPLAALGDPAGCVKVCALITYAGSSWIGDQVLGSLPPGTCTLGTASGVDLGSFAGEQWFTACPSTVPAGRPTWGGLKVLYR
jgi:hypothetical protein